MGHYHQLAKYFFKKNLKSIISFSIILFISTIMFVDGLGITMNIGKDYDRKFDDLNTANVTYTIPGVQYNDEIVDEIKELKIVSSVEVASGILLTIPVQMNDSTQNQNIVFYKNKEFKEISKYNIYKETTQNLEYACYIPYYIYSNSTLDINDDFEFEIESIKYTFKIQGIIEEMQYGNYAGSILGIYLEESAYQYLLENTSNFEVKTIMMKSDHSKEAYSDASRIFSNQNITVLNKGYDEAKKQSRLSVSNILTLILLAFSIIILLISILVTKFKIKQTIEEDITNMGVLKSLGYKSTDVIVGIMIPYILTTFIVSILGVILAIPVLKLLGNIISKQAGFIWIPKLNLLAVLITFILNLGLIILFSYLSARRIKKLNPIEAIRGINNKKPNKNNFRIEKTKGNINVILALKNFINSISGNVLLGMVLLFITILASFVTTLFYNVNVNPMNFINTLVEEHPTIMVKQKEDIKEDVSKIDGIDYVIYYDENCEVNLRENSYKTFVAEGYERLANDLVYEGKNPSKVNEVAVGSNIKKEFNYKIGDTIEISKNGNTASFEIVGFIQSVNYSGEILELTIDGFKLLDSSYQPNYLYIYASSEQEEQVDALIKKINNTFGDKIEASVNYVESMNSAASMFLNLIKLITIVIIIITLIIIFLILNILISGIIQNKKLELGILKSIGYKTNNLIFQIVGGFVPSILLFILFGLIFSKLAMSGIFGSIFKMVGSYKVGFEYPMWLYVMVALFIILSTIGIGILLCRKIKKITVYSLIKD